MVGVAGWGAGLASTLLVAAAAAVTDLCETPSVPEVDSLTLTNDIKVFNPDTRMCYKCYNGGSHKFQVKLNKIELVDGKSSVMIYVDGAATLITQDCGGCDATEENQEESPNCQDCEAFVGFFFELYFRQDRGQPMEGENACQNLGNFSISLLFDFNRLENDVPTNCQEGLMATLPLKGDSCTVNTTYGMEQHCLVQSCTDYSSPDEFVDKIEHKFEPLLPPETCIWQLNTKQKKYLTLRFSQNIRPHLTVFEESLANPKWDIEWCPAYNDDYRLETEADTVFVVYYNPSELIKKGSLSISIQTDLCPLPPGILNGTVEFERHESGTVALYSCDKGFHLEGPSKLTCKEGIWGVPPTCIRDNKEKLMSDAPMGSVESEDRVNKTELASENGTNLIAGGFEPQGKWPEQSLDLDNDITGVEKEMDRTETTDIVETFVTGDLMNLTAGFDKVSNDTLGLPFLNITILEEGNSTSTVEEESIIDKLLKFDLEDELTRYVLIGAAGLFLLLLILIITLVVYRKKYPVRLGLGRRFDTFQNPIYEKTVVRMQVEEPEEETKKSDAEEMSDCTVLE